MLPKSKAADLPFCRALPKHLLRGLQVEPTLAGTSRKRLFPCCVTANIQAGARMANYLARVELHLAGPEDYEKLHVSMLERGYVRKITGEDGVAYRFPTGTYCVFGTIAALSWWRSTRSSTPRTKPEKKSAWHP